MQEEFEVGDRVFVEQAWEDGAGHYHDEDATITEIHKGQIRLSFDDEKIDNWLKSCTYEPRDLKLLERKNNE